MALINGLIESFYSFFNTIVNWFLSPGNIIFGNIADIINGWFQ
jgi:hypothetical protein